MELSELSFRGPEFEGDHKIVTRLPPNLISLLQQVNGFIQFRGALHVRGVCSAPEWHSLARVMTGEQAIHRLFPAVKATDVPFAQNCVADQFLLREGTVLRLWAETGEVEALGVKLSEFFAAVEANPVEYLAMQPLAQFQRESGDLLPGQVLNVYPPFCTQESANGVSLKAIPSLQGLAWLAHLSSQFTNLPDGAKIRFKVVP